MARSLFHFHLSMFMSVQNVWGFLFQYYHLMISFFFYLSTDVLMDLSHLPLCFVFFYKFSYQDNSFRLILKIGPLLFSSPAVSAPVLFQGYISRPENSILYWSRGLTRAQCNGTSACLMDSPSAIDFPFAFTIFYAALYWQFIHSEIDYHIPFLQNTSS